MRKWNVRIKLKFSMRWSLGSKERRNLLNFSINMNSFRRSRQCRTLLGISCRMSCGQGAIGTRFSSNNLITFQLLIHPFSIHIHHNLHIYKLLQQAPQSPCTKGLSITLFKNVITFTRDGRKNRIYITTVWITDPICIVAMSKHLTLLSFVLNSTAKRTSRKRNRM